MIEKEDVLTRLAALSHGIRLDIIRLLVPHGKEGINAGEIGSELSEPASKLSFHLSALEHAGLIVSRKESRKVFYAANYPAIGSVIGYLTIDCCGQHPEICTLWPGGIVGQSSEATP